MLVPQRRPEEAERPAAEVDDGDEDVGVEDKAHPAGAEWRDRRRRFTAPASCSWVRWPAEARASP